MRTGIVKNGVLINIIDSDAEFNSTYNGDYDELIDIDSVDPEAVIGSTWDGNSFTRPPNMDIVYPEPVLPEV